MKTIFWTEPAFFALALLIAGCETADPTSAVIDNAYPPPDGTNVPTMTVYKAWWSVALFPDPVPAGQSSDPVRVVKGTDYAYALLAPGWDPASGTTPTALIPLRTTLQLTADRGDTLHIPISDETTIGNCAAGESLSADDAAFITERIFPGEFASVSYDPATCAETPIADDAGSD